MSTVDLTGRVAVVTGGAAGIGAAAVRRLAALGARVAVVDVDDAGAERLAREVGGLAITADVAEHAAMRTVIARTESTLGRVDVVHLNAGMGGGQAALDERLDAARYRKVIGVNVDHVIFGTCAAVPALRRAGGGAIVVSAALAGLEPVPADPLYTLSKHAVVGYVRAAGASLGAEGIRMCALCPGFVDTMLRGAAGEELDEATFTPLTPEQVADALETVLAEGEPGQAWIVRPGERPAPYRFPSAEPPTAVDH